jgi:tRNA 2-thiocytidine biosynthesis protein TtcA
MTGQPVRLHRDPRKADYELGKLAKRLRRQVGEAIADFKMIEEGDKVMVCLSGGKDSHGLLDVLLSLREKAPVRFDLIAVNLDQKQPGFPAHVLPEYLEARGVPFRIEEQDTYSVVKRVIPEGNLFHGGQLKAMPAKLVSDDGRHVVIRPLAYVAEADLAAYAAAKRFPIIPCTLCGSQDNLERKQIGEMLRDWERRSPGRIESIVRALTEVRPSHLLDRKLFDFTNMK